MVKIPQAKNSLAIDHRALQTDGNVSHKANPKVRLNHPQAPGAWLQAWSSGSSCARPGPHGVASAPAAHLGP